jgi:formylglycine-generating enzyme required for sulfatase activity
MRVIRGGDYTHYDWLCRSAYRCMAIPDRGNDYIGFRVVMESR